MTETTLEAGIDRHSGDDEDRPHRQHASADVAPELFESDRNDGSARSHEPARSNESSRSHERTRSHP